MRSEAGRFLVVLICNPQMPCRSASTASICSSLVNLKIFSATAVMLAPWSSAETFPQTDALCDLPCWNCAFVPGGRKLQQKTVWDFLLPPRWPWCAASWTLHHLQCPTSWWLARHPRRERAHWCTQGKWTHLAISHQSLKRANLRMDLQWGTPSQQHSGSPSAESCAPSAGSGHCILGTEQSVQPRLETNIQAVALLLSHPLASATRRKRQEAHWIVKWQLCGCLSLASRPLDAWSKFLGGHVSARVWEAGPWKLQRPDHKDFFRRQELSRSLQCDLPDSLWPK